MTTKHPLNVGVTAAILNDLEAASKIRQEIQDLAPAEEVEATWGGQRGGRGRYLGWASELTRRVFAAGMPAVMAELESTLAALKRRS